MSAPRLAWVRCQTRPFVAYVTTGSLPQALWSVWWDAAGQTWRAQVLSLSALCGTGGAAYLAAARLLRCHELGWLLHVTCARSAPANHD